MAGLAILCLAIGCLPRGVERGQTPQALVGLWLLSALVAAYLYVVARAWGLALFTVYPSLGILLAGMHRSRDVADPAIEFLAPEMWWYGWTATAALGARGWPSGHGAAGTTFRLSAFRARPEAAQGAAYVVWLRKSVGRRSADDATCGQDLRGGRQFVSRIRRWIGCSGRAFIGKGSLKRSMSVWATATGAANTFHSTTSEHGGVVSEPS